MASRQIMLEAAAEEKNGANLDDIVKQIRKLMQTAKLTRFRSVDTCQRVYNALFLCSVEGDPDLDAPQWMTVYMKLLGDDPFCSDLAIMMVCWQPPVYAGMFGPLWGKIESDLMVLEKSRVTYLSMIKGALVTLQARYNGVGEIVRSQVRDGNVMKFLTVIDQQLNQFQSNLTAMVQVELAKAVRPDDVIYQNTMYQPISEGWSSVLNLLENGESIIENEVESELNESVIRDAALKAKEMNVVRKRKERDFDTMVTRKIHEIRENRQNRKHEEIVGETINVSHRIKQILRTVGAGFIAGPVVAAIVAVAQIAYDRHTDAKDRATLVADLKDELEIIDEKISAAERAGDDKARIELIRVKQKLQREYDRIGKAQYTARARDQLKAAKNY